MTPEEIKRLREEIHYGSIVTPFSSLTKCLDTIEAQAKEIDRLQAAYEAQRWIAESTKNLFYKANKELKDKTEVIHEISSGNYCYCVTTGKCHYCKLRECLARWGGK